MPGLHCIPPWKRERSPRKRIPSIVAYLVARHAGEWAVGCRGTMNYLYAEEVGYWVFLRTPALERKWLISALVLTQTPKGKGGWSGLQDAYFTSGFQVSNAKHRYLFVRSRLYAEAKQYMARSPITILDWDRIHQCSAPSPSG